jgi:hypothetical protein
MQQFQHNTKPKANAKVEVSNDGKFTLWTGHFIY